MYNAVGTVALLDPGLIQVGGVIGQCAQRCGLVQGAVRLAGVVEVLVLAQDGHEVPLQPGTC
ncbi:MAG: hypothetical protein M3Z75_23935 [Actinomycetota bacterium]|nr:hypothetical protein [Actinomycetota bacterium]